MITPSSRARQQRGDEIIAGVASGQVDPLSVLWNKDDRALPVYRAQGDDPDHENTLATAVFHIGAECVEWRVYDRADLLPRFTLRDLG